MPVDPADVDGSGDEVARHWSVFELATLAWLAAELRKGTPPHVVRRRLLADTSRAGVEGARLASNAVDKAWRAGERSARRDIARIEKSAASLRTTSQTTSQVSRSRPAPAPHAMAPPTFIDAPAPPTLGPVQGPRVTPADVARTGQPDRRALPAAKRAVEQATAALSEGMGRAARETAVRAAGQYEAIVRELAKAQLAGEATALQVQQRALNEWARKGLPSFTDKAGRTWSNQAYSEMLTRTVTQRAYRDAAHATLVAEGYDLVIVSSHRNPAPMCQPYERKVLSLTGRTRGIVQIPSALTGDMVTVEVTASMAEAEAQGYHHPNAVLGGSQRLDALAGAVGASKGTYRGPAVTISTAKGNHVTVSPKHPVLTGRGWVTAESVRAGDHVFRALPSDDLPVSAVDLDGDDVLPTVEQVFRAVEVVGDSSFAPTSGLDFNDDRQFLEGEVHVVTTEHCLLPVPDTHVIEQTGEVRFVWSDVQPLSLTGHGPHPLGEHGVGLAVTGALAEGDSAGDQTSTDSGSGDVEVWGDVLATHPALVHGDDAVVVNGLVGREFDARLDEPVPYSRWGDSQDPRTVELAVPGGIEADEVVEVDVKPFLGHAYDFHTVDGVYVVNGVVVHNCKHVESAFVPDVTRPGGTEPNPEGYEATQQQRYYERKIREWKRRAAVAEEEHADYAKAKVREWQARTREHVRVHGLDRRYYRETPMVGAA